MFSGKGKGKSNEDRNSRNDIIEEIDMKDIHKNMRSRSTSSDNKETGHPEEASRVYSRGQSGSIGDIIDDKPQLQRGLKARHVNYSFFLFLFLTELTCQYLF